MCNITVSDISLNGINRSTLDDDESKEEIRNARDDIIKRLMNLSTRHNFTKAAIEDVAKVLNSVPGSSIQIPTTKYMLFKEFLCKSSVNIYKYYFCSICTGFSKFEFSNSLLRCHTRGVDLKKSETSFIYIPTASQLKQIVSTYFDEIMDYKKICNERKGDYMFDVHDGIYLKSITECENLFSLTFNTDGVVIHQSSNRTLWALLLACNFLPPAIRFKEDNIIVAGLHYGVEKPDFMKYFVPLNDECSIQAYF